MTLPPAAALHRPDGHRIRQRFAYEGHNTAGGRFRSHGNGPWKFDDRGVMRLRLVPINDRPIAGADRKFRPPQGLRPEGQPGLSAIGLRGHRRRMT